MNPNQKLIKMFNCSFNLLCIQTPLYEQYFFIVLNRTVYFECSFICHSRDSEDIENTGALDPNSPGHTALLYMLGLLIILVV